MSHPIRAYTMHNAPPSIAYCIKVLDGYFDRVGVG